MRQEKQKQEQMQREKRMKKALEDIETKAKEVKRQRIERRNAKKAKKEQKRKARRDAAAAKKDIMVKDDCVPLDLDQQENRAMRDLLNHVPHSQLLPEVIRVQREYA